jgi:hypothetical protein
MLSHILAAALVLAPTQHLGAGHAAGAPPAREPAARAAVPAQSTDTVVTVPAGARLELSSMGGSIAVRSWQQNTMRVQATHSSRARIEIRVDGSVVTVRAVNGMAAMGPIDYVITVPQAMSVRLNSMNSPITVDGVQGEVSAETMQGRVAVTGGSRVLARAVNGNVLVDGARDRVDARAVSGNVRVTGVTGDVHAESISGNVELDGIDGTVVDAATVSGNVSYDGQVRDGGRYRLTSHSGRVGMTIPAGTNARVSLATMTGRLSTDFADVTLPEGGFGTRRHTVTLGTGSATIELETFNGNIDLRRRNASGS